MSLEQKVQTAGTNEGLAAKVQSPQNHRTYNILIIDYSELAERFLADNINAYYHQSNKANIVAVQNSLDVLAQTQKHKFDLIISEVNPMQQDYYGLLEQIRTQPDYKTTPILVWTGMPEEMIEKQKLEAIGVKLQEIFFKYADLATLLQRINAYCPR